LNRPEALAVLHEVMSACGELLLSSSCVNLAPNSQVVRQPVGYEIRLKCELDSQSRQCLMPLLVAHGLSAQEEKGYVIIFKP